MTVGGQPATNVSVANYNSLNATTPALPPGTVNPITVTNTDASASTLVNGWVADFLDVPSAQQFYLFVTTLVSQPDHRRRRRRQLWRRPADAAPADGGVPAEGQARHLLRAAAVHRDVRGRRLSVDLRGLDRGPGGRGHHRRLRQRQLLPAESGASRPDGRFPPEDEVRLGIRASALHRHFPRRALRIALCATGSSSSSPRTSRAAAAGATIARTTTTPADRWRFSSSRLSICSSESGEAVLVVRAFQPP